MLSNYINTLVNCEDSMSVVAKAFEPIANKYRIGQFRSRFYVPHTFSTRGGEDREDVLYSNGEKVEEQAGYTISYKTGENGVAVFMLHRYLGEPEFSEEDKVELKIFLDVLFIHFGRYRLINSIRRSERVDYLTGLFNTIGFIDYLDDMIKKQIHTDYNVFYFNLARFNLVNKRFGRKETDFILARYATEVKGFLKDKECLGRLGGDNFVAIIEKSRTFQFLGHIATVKTYGMLGEQRIPITISAVAGVGEMDEHTESGGNIISDCGMALNVAKHIEKKNYVFASNAIREKMHKEQQYVSNFAKAIKRREFKVFYQPKVNTDDYSIVGAEALARWQRGEELLLPGEFIRIFEQNGLICKLDFYILEQVCKDIHEWIEKGIEPGRISVNLSRKHLSNYYLAEDIMHILSKYEMESKYIEIELTETVDEQESEQLITFIRKMKQNNIAVSIDDFGTGYSSLNLLRIFRVDVLKIDKSFIDRLESCDKIVLSNIIKMAIELHMDVVVEGVENKEQLAYLKEINCTTVQGFLFDRPMPKDVFEEKMYIGKYEL